MTEYTVKVIGQQWMVCADGKSIAACADEASALNLIIEHSAAKSARRKSIISVGEFVAHDPRLQFGSSTRPDRG